MLAAISPSIIDRFSDRYDVSVLRASANAAFALALAIILLNVGINIAAKMPITAITIISSTIVKARLYE